MSTQNISVCSIMFMSEISYLDDADN